LNIKNEILILLILVSVLCVSPVKADSTHVSFESLSKGKKYTSISFGMGAIYGNNTSLKNFIQYEIPNYGLLTRDQQLSEFYTGLDFFGGIEKQISKDFSIKAEYSYFIKSYNVNMYPQYDFSYSSHQPGLMLFYIIPQEYSYIKVGAGTGYVLSNLTVKEYGLEKSYTSKGIGLKAELIFNAQIGKSFASYISGYISNTFLQNLKDNNGNELLTNVTKENVNLSGFGAGIRLGVEIFFF
jgi:hypothetical protein